MFQVLPCCQGEMKGLLSKCQLLNFHNGGQSTLLNHLIKSNKSVVFLYSQICMYKEIDKTNYYYSCFNPLKLLSQRPVITLL